jgi:hypothetical protein
MRVEHLVCPDDARGPGRPPAGDRAPVEPVAHAGEEGGALAVALAEHLAAQDPQQRDIDRRHRIARVDEDVEIDAVDDARIPERRTVVADAQHVDVAALVDVAARATRSVEDDRVAAVRVGDRERVAAIASRRIIRQVSPRVQDSRCRLIIEHVLAVGAPERRGRGAAHADARGVRPRASRKKSSTRDRSCSGLSDRTQRCRQRAAGSGPTGRSSLPRCSAAPLPRCLRCLRYGVLRCGVAAGSARRSRGAAGLPRPPPSRLVASVAGARGATRSASASATERRRRIGSLFSPSSAFASRPSRRRPSRRAPFRK